jgi:hypothetical protein
MNTLRIYQDTSVIGGCCDEEFAEASCRLIEMVKRGEVALLISVLLAEELEDAPPDEGDLGRLASSIVGVRERIR